MMKLRPLREWRLPLALVIILFLAVGFILRPESATPDSGWFGKTVRTVFAPAVWVAAGMSGLWAEAPAERRPEEVEALRAEIAALRTELEIARRELAEWRSGERVGRGGMTVDVPERYRFLAADVIARQPQPRRQSVLLNRGERHGVDPGMPVVTDAGLFGVVRQVHERTSLVQLLTDPYYAVAAEEESGEWRAIAMGQGMGEPLVLEPEEPVLRPRPGAAIKTSGLEGSLYPRGLLIGHLETGAPSRLGLESLELVPAADLDARFVLILQEW